jgi:hypothetical protein
MGGSCARRHRGYARPRLVVCEHEQQRRLPLVLAKVRKDLACAPVRNKATAFMPRHPDCGSTAGQA